MSIREWETFYVIMGTAAGALIGLQFIVMTLIAQSNARTKADAGAAFATPTIIHFSNALLISALVSVPWRDEKTLFQVLTSAGCFGLVYMGFVLKRMKRQHSYQPVAEDWICHMIIPCMIYAILCGAFYLGEFSEYAVAVVVMGLVATGIHNTWDALTFHVFSFR